MLQPSYRELMDELSKKDDIGKLASRYAIAIAVSKRARQIIDGDESRVGAVDGNKAVSIAVNEMYEGHIRVYQDESYIEAEKEKELVDFDKGMYQSLDDALENHKDA